jgi:cytochrome c-type protein NapC
MIRLESGGSDRTMEAGFRENSVYSTHTPGLSDIYHELMGTISTREKYEAHRARMAEDVWAYMVKTDSRECRSCHSEEHFVLTDQPEKAAKAHVTGPEEGKTCNDCHKGIAHKTPDEIAEEQQGAAAP